MSVLATKRPFLPDYAFRLVLRDAKFEAPETSDIVHQPPRGANRVPDWIEVDGSSHYLLELDAVEVNLEGGNEYGVTLIATGNKWLGDDLNEVASFSIPGVGRYVFNLTPPMIEAITAKPYVAIRADINEDASVSAAFNYTAAIMRSFG